MSKDNYVAGVYGAGAGLHNVMEVRKFKEMRTTPRIEIQFINTEVKK